MSVVRDFTAEWARMFCWVIVIVAGGAFVMASYWLIVLLPWHVGAYIEAGLLPGQAGFVPIDGTYAWYYTAAEYVWFGLLLSAGAAGVRTFGSDESNGGDSV